MAEDLDNMDGDQDEVDFEEALPVDDVEEEDQEAQPELEQAQEDDQDDTPSWFRAFADRLDEVGADLGELRQQVEDGKEPFVPEGPSNVPTIEELDAMFPPLMEGVDPEGGYPSMAGGEGVAVMDDGEGNQAIVGDPLVGDPEQAENEDRDLPEDSCVVQITAEEAGGGKYTGVILYGGNASDPAVDTNMPEGLTEDSENTVLVINVAEDGSAGHALAVDGTVYALGEVRGITDEATPRRIVYIEQGVTGISAVVKIIANATGGGKYNGRILSGDSTAADTGDLTMPEGMTVPAANDCLVLNTDEDGLPTHWLKLDTFATGVKVGMTTEETPRAIVVIPRGVARTASPSTLGSAAEGTTTADTKEWQRDAVSAGDVYGDCPLEVWFVSRVVYDHAGDKILYQMMRKLTLAADGRGGKVGPETRVEIDTPDNCP